MSTKVTGIPTVKKHWYKSAVLPWAIIIFVIYTSAIFIASYFYTMTITQQHSANVQREAVSIVKLLK